MANDYENQRVKKLEALRERGINPYPYSYQVDKSFKEIRNEYEEKIDVQEETEDYFSLAGRIMLKRDMGGLLFMTLQDEDSKLQAVFVKDKIGEENFELLEYFEMGDIIGIKGNVFKTKKGELSIKVNEFQILSKCVTELGDKYHGIKDIETKYRNRTLDMIMNSDSKQTLKNRFLILQKIREFMNNEKFLEIETPILQNVYGGAAAKPFTTHHNFHDMNLYLRVAPEQHLKRVISGGMEAVYEINKNFRNESIDRTHNPEFTMLEAYKAYVDYEYMMDMCERLVEYVALEVFGTLEFEFKGEKVSFERPWQRVKVKDALEEKTGWELDKLSDEELFSEVEKLGKEFHNKTRGEAILILFEEYAEDKYIQPTHFIDYPKESTPFSKSHREDPELIERFESFVCGMEISNAYSELNDPVLQRKLLEEQVKMGEEGAEEIWGQVDEEFLEAMELGMPPTGGIGIGIDRLVMVLLNKDSIRDIIYFPTMKPNEGKE